MSAKQIITVTELPVTDIEGFEDEHRLRRVTEAGCAALMASIEELGVMKDAIQVRRVRHQDNRLVLMAGGHRLAVAKMLGWDMIPANLWECSDDWAQLMEVDDNLASRELNALDTAVFLAKRKRIYEKLHPETVRGKAGMAARWHTSDTMSFVSVTSEKFGMSKRNVERIVAAGQSLSQEEVLELSKSPRQVTLADLQTLSKVSDIRESAHIIDALKAGKVKNAAAAQLAYRETQGAGKKAAVKDPVKEAVKALKAAWKKAPKKARTAFVEATPELREMLDGDA